MAAVVIFRSGIFRRHKVGLALAVLPFRMKMLITTRAANIFLALDALVVMVDLIMLVFLSFFLFMMHLLLLFWLFFLFLLFLWLLFLSF